MGEVFGVGRKVVEVKKKKDKSLIESRKERKSSGRGKVEICKSL